MWASDQSSPSPPHLPTVSVLIKAEWARGAGGAETSNQISALAGIWTPDLSIDSIERETLESTNFDYVIDQFATVKSRKINLL